MFLRRTQNDLAYYTSPLLSAANIPHAFSTRTGGVSPPPFDSLNLGLARDATQKDHPDNVDENYRRLITAINCPTRTRCWVSQIHTNNVRTLRPNTPFTNGQQADALVTDDPTRLISIKYADCVPILLATPDGTAVAAIHAGWRGLIAGVIANAIQQLTQITNTTPADLIAAIGPCIGPDNFEVGPEVAAEFQKTFGPSAPLHPGRNDRSHVDLTQATTLQLTAAGLPQNQIDAANLCTFAHPADFFSHRRNGPATGRMAAIIGPIPPPQQAGA